MAAETINRPDAGTPAQLARDIVSTDERGDGYRVHRFRWHAGAEEGDGFLTERIVPVTREIIEDRWRGLWEDSQGDPTRPHVKLIHLLFGIADGLTRRSVGAPDPVIIDGQITHADHVMDIDGLMDVIREWMIERASRPGAAL